MDNEIRAGRTPARRELTDEPLLVVDDLRTSFAVAAGSVRAVDGVSLSLDRGRTLGVVGESGSGKTVLSRSIMGLNTTTNSTTTGSVRYAGDEIIHKTPSRRSRSGAPRWRWSSRTR
jgi:ABC-type dipeptide/oligopeptide/nickel transport system ATPase component